MKISNFHYGNWLYPNNLNLNFEVKNSASTTALLNEVSFKYCDKNPLVVQKTCHSWAAPYFLSAGNYVDAICQQLAIQTFILPLKFIHNSDLLCNKTPLDVDFSCSFITNHPQLTLIPEHEPQKPKKLSNWKIVDFFRKANKNYRKIAEDYQRSMRNWAAHMYQCRLSQFPLIARLHLLHALVSLLNNRLEDASNAIDQSIFYNPHDLQVYLIKFISDYRKNKDKLSESHLKTVCKQIENLPLENAANVNLLESLILNSLQQNKQILLETSCLNLIDVSRLVNGSYDLCYKSKLHRKCFLLLLDAYDFKIQFLKNKEKLNIFEIIPQLFSRFDLTVESDPHWIQKIMEELNSLVLLESIEDNWYYAYLVLDIFIFESLFIISQNIDYN